MTQFEKEFVLTCLDFFTQILSEKEELDQAIISFAGENTEQSRYHSNSSIPDSELWTDQDKLQFSAAFFEATARANYQFVTSPELSTQVTQAQTLWQNHYKPLLSSNTAAENRIITIIQNSNRIKADVNKTEPSDAPQNFVQDNPYTFFTALTALGVITAVGAAIVFKP
ncbi:hypothetical protein [Legionella bononiensis]|uniref:Uncharacterized protein n=1 Tax=Legionella bononiensis TaxID=2793102 RepID=A0ABS1WAX5_9GAMM|nr:hypothetical protein [Legionella bononiensis]MBL7480259.1 hypothetical protein [Legionella bononiensis]MBL7526509.1 hypothetical protein [Legionella bononiensis]MBL7562997.1 hypothetical protein [Legionella bononiensis]